MVTHTGIKWVDGKELSDLDFADIIVLLHGLWAGIQAMTSTLEDEAKQVGLLMINDECDEAKGHGYWKLVNIGKNQSRKLSLAGL